MCLVSPGKICVFLSIIALTLTSCASQKTIANLGAEYMKANQAAVDSVSVETNQVKRVRRVAAVAAYINTPNTPLAIKNNINSNEIDESFANFVCTGEDDFEKISAGLKFTSAYAKTLNAITKAPEDSIEGYISALHGLKGKDKALALPDIQKDQFEKCRQNVKSDIPKAKEGIDAGPERVRAFVPAAITAFVSFQALIDSIQKLLKDGLKMATEAEQRVVLKSFITKNQENYQKVLEEFLSSKELKEAFKRRRQTTLTLPYYEFQDMMKLSTTTHRSEIMRRAIQVDQNLAEYDVILLLPHSPEIVEQFKEINQKLQDYVDGKVSLADIVQFLSETASELEGLKKDYDDIGKKSSSLQDAIGAIGK